jgi:hypothetical protein
MARKREISNILGAKPNSGFRDTIGVKVDGRELLTGREKSGQKVSDLPFLASNVRKRFAIDDAIRKGGLAPKATVEEAIKRLRQRRGGARSLLTNQRLADVLGG